MNLYLISKKDKAHKILNDGAAGGGLICTDEKKILSCALEYFGAESVDNGEVAAYLVDFPEIYQESLFNFWTKSGYKPEEMNTAVFTGDIPSQWVSAAFEVFDYTDGPQGGIS